MSDYQRRAQGGWPAQPPAGRIRAGRRPAGYGRPGTAGRAIAAASAAQAPAASRSRSIARGPPGHRRRRGPGRQGLRAEPDRAADRAVRAQRQAVGQHRGLAVPHPDRSRTSSRRSTSARTTSRPTAASSRSASPPRPPGCTSTPRSTARPSTTSTGRTVACRPPRWPALFPGRGVTLSAGPADGPNAVKVDAGIAGSVTGTVKQTARTRSPSRSTRSSGLAALLGELSGNADQVITIPQLPAGLVVKSVSVTSQGIVATASASNTTLSQ